jgi:hypothetical protein
VRISTRICCMRSGSAGTAPRVPCVCSSAIIPFFHVKTEQFVNRTPGLDVQGRRGKRRRVAWIGALGG